MISSFESLFIRRKCSNFAIFHFFNLIRDVRKGLGSAMQIGGMNLPPPAFSSGQRRRLQLWGGLPTPQAVSAVPSPRRGARKRHPSACRLLAGGSAPLGPPSALAAPVGQLEGRLPGRELPPLRRHRSARTQNSGAGRVEVSDLDKRFSDQRPEVEGK